MNVFDHGAWDLFKQNSGIVWDPGQFAGSLCGRDVPIETFTFAVLLLISFIDRSRH